MMDEKLRVVFEYVRDEESMKALCERFGISRETGYVWLRRYRQVGPEGLVESIRVWCADFKGWFRSGNGARIDPLTISDARSRYLLRSQAVERCTLPP